MKSNALDNFQRDISYQIQNSDDGQIMLMASLNDKFHDIRIEVAVSFDSLVVTAARVDFVRHPSRYCPDVASQIGQLVGFAIGRGLSRKLQEMFGGSGGCGNLKVMLQGLLPLVLNVKAVAEFTNTNDEQAMFDAVGKRLAGTCMGYPG